MSTQDEQLAAKDFSGAIRSILSTGIGADGQPVKALNPPKTLTDVLIIDKFNTEEDKDA
jgi:hypothetical protein